MKKLKNIESKSIIKSVEEGVTDFKKHFENFFETTDVTHQQMALALKINIRTLKRWLKDPGSITFKQLGQVVSIMDDYTA